MERIYVVRTGRDPKVLGEGWSTNEAYYNAKSCNTLPLIDEIYESTRIPSNDDIVFMTKKTAVSNGIIK